ncbi:TetR/AcrR family transcriptional regulator [Aliikangiella sp. G2MR2-5]|uniref:TetR/AcrR family transcriptional regulator n=1 Tax=Aliikangiella sp. G2MR2-5 TaxID=2788943 RepID=UPI0018A95C01|nr:TetR/AcrR family transcriptional regulator [Aliikangiella sp. G2MR2-5]
MVRKKNPQQTRQQILEVTAELLHKHGYKGLRVDEVVEKTGLTKGAIYHHFPNKQALGYAVVDELLHGMFMQHWQDLVEQNLPPLETLKASFDDPRGEVCLANLEVGCPLTNLGQEMAYEDEGFRERINNVFESWTEQLAQVIQKGIDLGHIKNDIEPVKTARFLVSAFQGIQSNSKCTKDIRRYQENIDYLRKIIGDLGV